MNAAELARSCGATAVSVSSATCGKRSDAALLAGRSWPRWIELDAGTSGQHTCAMRFFSRYDVLLEGFGAVSVGTAGAAGAANVCADGDASLGSSASCALDPATGSGFTSTRLTSTACCALVAARRCIAEGKPGWYGPSDTDTVRGTASGRLCGGGGCCCWVSAARNGGSGTVLPLASNARTAGSQLSGPVRLAPMPGCDCCMAGAGGVGMDSGGAGGSLSAVSTWGKAPARTPLGGGVNRVVAARRPRSTAMTKYVVGTQADVNVQRYPSESREGCLLALSWTVYVSASLAALTVPR